MKSPLYAVAFAALLAAGSARADFDLTRETTLADDHGGQLHVLTQGTLGADAAERTTVATFSNFHPRTADSHVDGQIERHFQRIDEDAQRVYNGALTITSSGEEGSAPRVLNLAFESLTVIRGDDGASLSGTLVVNGNRIDAGQAPGAVKRILLRLLRFLHY